MYNQEIIVDEWGKDLSLTVPRLYITGTCLIYLDISSQF